MLDYQTKTKERMCLLSSLLIRSIIISSMNSHLVGYQVPQFQFELADSQFTGSPSPKVIMMVFCLDFGPFFFSSLVPLSGIIYLFIHDI